MRASLCWSLLLHSSASACMWLNSFCFNWFIHQTSNIISDYTEKQTQMMFFHIHTLTHANTQLEAHVLKCLIVLCVVWVWTWLSNKSSCISFHISSSSAALYSRVSRGRVTASTPPWPWGGGATAVCTSCVTNIAHNATAHTSTNSFIIQRSDTAPVMIQRPWYPERSPDPNLQEQPRMSVQLTSQTCTNTIQEKL